MIVSASRRTDIPAFYSDWFFRRLEEGYLYVKNPMNPRQVSKILLSPDTVDCFVFWTKDPAYDGEAFCFEPAGVSLLFPVHPDTLWDGCGTGSSP